MSTVASAAAFVGLADVLCRASRMLYVFFAAVKDAPQEVRRLLAELNSLETVFAAVKAYGTQLEKSSILTSTIHTQSNTLKSCQDVFNGLERIAKTASALRSRGRVMNIVKQFEWVLDRKEVIESCQRLERLKLNLVLALQAAHGSVWYLFVDRAPSTNLSIS